MHNFQLSTAAGIRAYTVVACSFSARVLLVQYIVYTQVWKSLSLSLFPPSLLGFNNAALTTAAKDREAKAKKRYGKMKKDPSPKLYDKPPNLR